MDQPGDNNPKTSLSDYLAAERTLLAWLRTGLALMGFGFVVARFGLFLQQLQAVRGVAPKPAYGLSLWFGTALIAVGVLLNGLSGYRHLQLVRRLDRGETSYSHPTAQSVSIAFFLAFVGILMAVYLLFIKG
jgi:putative membrane protein